MQRFIVRETCPCGCQELLQHNEKEAAAREASLAQVSE